MRFSLFLKALSLVGVLAAAPHVHAQPRPANLAATSTSGSLSALKYTKVGGAGSYDQVVDIKPGTFPSCDVSPSCVTQPKAISGTSPCLNKVLLSHAEFNCDCVQGTGHRSMTR